MKRYAVIETGGKQYRVEPSDTLRVERLDSKVGETIDIRPVLAVSDGAELTIGKPEVKGARVSAVVQEHVRGPKLISFKKRRRKGYERKRGHRQELSVLRIEDIENGTLIEEPAGAKPEAGKAASEETGNGT